MAQAHQAEQFWIHLEYQFTRDPPIFDQNSYVVNLLYFHQ